MVNRYNNKKQRKNETKKTKKLVKSFPNLSPTNCGCVFVVKGWLGGMVKW
jgi:hypothetical protein